MVNADMSKTLKSFRLSIILKIARFLRVPIDVHQSNFGGLKKLAD